MTEPFQWETTPEEAFGLLFQQLELNIEGALLALAQSWSPIIEAWMKANAAWEDRTGNARQSLYAEVEQLVGEVSIIIDYDVDYGFWLAFANQGQYDIVRPALDYFAPQIMTDIQKLTA